MQDPLLDCEGDIRDYLADHITTQCPPLLAQAMEYAVFPGGARVRPQLCMAVALANNSSDRPLAAAAAAGAAAAASSTGASGAGAAGKDTSLSSSSEDSASAGDHAAALATRVAGGSPLARENLRGIRLSSWPSSQRMVLQPVLLISTRTPHVPVSVTRTQVPNGARINAASAARASGGAPGAD